MCRLLGYLGTPILLESLLTQPEHSLVVQSYDPQEMTAGLINADGFGVGWYPLAEEGQPYRYRNILPIWSDPNLADLSRFVQADCFLAAIRSATIGQSLQWSNCQPFQQGHLLGIHNGFIDHFRQTLWRPMHQFLSDQQAQGIQGSTDSEHIFALICHELEGRWPMAERRLSPSSLAAALTKTIERIAGWAAADQVSISLNLILSDGRALVASRFAIQSYPLPSIGHPLPKGLG